MNTRVFQLGMFLFTSFVGVIFYFAFDFIQKKKKLYSIGKALASHLLGEKISFKGTTDESTFSSFKKKLIKNSAISNLNIIIICVLIVYYLFFNTATNQYYLENFFLGVTGLIMSSLYLLKKIWPIILKKLLFYFWFVKITYCLSFLMTVNIMILYSHLNLIDWLVIFFLSTYGIFIILSILSSWEIALLSNFIGCFTAILYSKYAFFHKGNPFIMPSLSDFSVFTIWYILASIATMILLSDWLKNRKKETKKVLEYSEASKKEAIALNQELLNSYNQTVNQNIPLETFALDTCDEILASTDKEKIKEKMKSLHNYVDDINYISLSYTLKPKNFSAFEFIQEIKDNLFVLGKVELSFEFSAIRDKNIKLDFDVVKKVICYFSQTLCNKVQDTRCGEIPQILLTFHCTTLDYVRTGMCNDDKIEKVVRSVPALSISVAECSELGIKNSIPNPVYKKSLSGLEEWDDKDVSLRDIINGIEAHYGIMELSDENLTYKFILPLDIYDVRPVILDFFEPIANFYNCPEAEELEHNFLTELQELPLNCSMHKIYRAIEVIKKYHSHQTRKTGEPFYTHPLSVGKFLIHLIKNENSEIVEFLKNNLDVLILGGLLHDILEDTVYTNKAILSNFGNKVSETVMAVSKINTETMAIMLTEKDALNELIKKDPIALSIKMMDRYHNLLTIPGHKSIAKRHLVAQEALMFLAEPADRYGFVIFSDLLKRMCETILKTGTLDFRDFPY